MSRRPEPSRRSASARGAWLLAAVLALSACSSTGSTSKTEILDEGGFAITEKVRAGAEVRADFDGALRLLEQKRYAEGIALLVKVTEAAPELTAAHIDLALAYGELDDLERAEASLERALELSPRHPVVHNELGIVYRKTGRFEEARKSYQRALELHPDFHFARKNLAILCDVYLRDTTCALNHYALYAAAVPDDEAAAIWIADLRNRIGR
ncbi:MAG: tetratricopeptide repeat protein [Myxococcota bacterium]